MLLLDGLIVFITCAFLLWLFNNTSAARQAYPLPPGPRRLPILGNLLDVPSDYKWRTYQQWSNKYGQQTTYHEKCFQALLLTFTTGDVIYTEMFGQPVVVLNSLQAATDLLEKRAAKYSDRTRIPAFILFVTFQILAVAVG